MDTVSQAQQARLVQVLWSRFAAKSHERASTSFISCEVARASKHGQQPWKVQPARGAFNVSISPAVGRHKAQKPGIQSV